MVVVLGQCACVNARKEVPQLLSCGLPTPDWEATLEEARRHFPAGCDVGWGVWVKGDHAKESEETENVAHVAKTIKLLVETTNLKVWK